MTIFWSYRILKFKVFVFIVLSNLILSVLGNKTLAQITADDSLGNEQSVVSPASSQTDLIEGGAARGNNLFHSFQEFNIGQGREAYFANPVEIKNIFSRVTGSNPSRILGKLGVLGDANLFFINPNGIVFGENASLDVNGSFLASTANSILFPDGKFFSANNPQGSQPLLTIDVPIGLQFGGVPGNIINRSVVSDEDSGELVGLGVKPGKTLGLLGGDIQIEGGSLNAEAGRIELGSVTGNNTVNLTLGDEGFLLGYTGVNNFADISLSQAAEVDTRGDKGGDVQIQGREITLTEGSQVLLDSFGEGKVGDLTVKATESVKLEGTGIGEDEEGEFQFPSGFFGDVTDIGDGGIISIETKRLIVKNGGSISTSTFWEGKGGNLTIKASESVEVLGTAPNGDFPSALFADVFDTGDGGNLTIDTQKLIIKDGAQVSASTFGDGSAGNLIVKASESVQLEGVVLGTDIPSGLFTSVEEGATGNAGNLSIETGKITVRDGAQIASTARNGSKGGDLNINASDSILVSGTAPNATLISGQSGIFVSAEPAYTDESGELVPTTGNSGNLLINTGKLIVEDGGKISADTFGSGRAGELTLNVNHLIVRNGGLVRTGSLLEDGAVNQERGNAGNLTVNATESVQVIGTGTIGGVQVNSNLFTASEGSGDAGNIFVTTKKMDIRNGGEVTASSSGDKIGGNINLDVDSLTLDDGTISAQTRSNTGGNINLNLQDLLLLRNGSNISTTAGNQQFGGNGGNITINTPFIVALPQENSDITANAFSGNGGKIDITTNAIFGIFPRDTSTLFSDITATSQLGVNGEISIDTLDLDPSSGLVELPSNLVDTSQQIAQGCSTTRSRKRVNSFTRIGRGGLPLSPNESLRGRAVITNWVDLPSQIVSKRPNQRRNQLSAVPVGSQSSDRDQIIEAQDLVVDAKGDIFLVAKSTQSNVTPSGFSCGK
ncbi:beta strand repeat-containing protein [Mastigocoleus testarum]|uniref:Filamentous haemagglutinin FhaB/tRNA nuclease CdiA-like TPS domain-containing protein n=1 Tax=Mastigocoleus testarum BC008 TaxID=371196 RepID=A0A0V7ZN92_9CYAN|nr:S-layer family protein [Mastigocoleus testarum]KST65679.1 hypothetical protein BC008_22120 [Mastigocoleus testarum BC008]